MCENIRCLIQRLLLPSGLTGYVSDMSSELSRLDRIFRGGLLSLPGIPVLLGGCGENTVTMEIVEFGNWMKTTGEPYPVQTWETFLSGIISDQMGGTAKMQAKFRFRTNFETPR